MTVKDMTAASLSRCRRFLFWSEMATDTQTSYFTCGPVCLQVAMKRLKPERPYRDVEEFTIWREANAIFTHEGHAATGPYGLALAALARGFSAEVWECGLLAFYRHWNARLSPIDHIIVEKVDAYDRLEATRRGIAIYHQPFTLADIQNRIASGHVPIVLDTHEESGHWLAVLDANANSVTYHDPGAEHGSVNPATVASTEFMHRLRCPSTGAMASIVVKRRRGLINGVTIPAGEARHGQRRARRYRVLSHVNCD